jgi:hypothetical protein
LFILSTKVSSSKSILETINQTMDSNNVGSTPTVSSSSTSSGSSGGFFSSLFSVSITTWIIIILVLAFLGFNIFVYLAKGTQDITNFFAPIITKILGAFAMVTGQVVNTTATGAKAVVNTTADVIDAGLTGVQNVTQDATEFVSQNATQGKKAGSTIGGTSLSNAIPTADVMQNNTLNKALNNSNVKQNIGQTHEYIADDSSSSIQKTQSKGGYCYIGEDRGHRSCMRVNENDNCMSGEIFPTNEICINPSLRV